MAEAIEREGEFYANTARTNPEYGNAGRADIHRIRICGLYGDVQATLFGVLKDGVMLFFDVPFKEPQDNPYL